MLEIDILTLFPALCEGAFAGSMMKRAQEAGAARMRVHNLRDWARDKHRTTDDVPYGGGQGMVMKPEPIFDAVEALDAREHGSCCSVRRAGSSDRAWPRNTRAAHLIFVCGHYEGVDHRVSEFLADDELSLGDYVLTNGAIAAAVVVDATVRLLPGVLGDANRRRRTRSARATAGCWKVPSTRARRLPGSCRARGAAFRQPCPNPPLASGTGAAADEQAAARPVAGYPGINKRGRHPGR